MGLTAHMSPVEADPDWYVANTGRRPIAHLAELGVLGPEVCLTHAVHLDDHEVALLAEAGANVTHCPMSALKGAYGASVSGKFPEMAAQGVNLMLGTDGNNNGNIGDLMRAMFLAAGLFKHARRDTRIFPAHEVLTMATLNGARGMGLSDQIGSLEVGKRADLVVHETSGPSWRPRGRADLNIIWGTDGRSVRDVVVDGEIVIRGRVSTKVDEAELAAKAQEAQAALLRRAGFSL